MLDCQMSSRLDNLAWFYRGNMEQSSALSESLDHKIVYYILVTCTVVGFLTIFSRIIQFARLVLSLYIFPGTPVYPSIPPNAAPSD